MLPVILGNVGITLSGFMGRQPNNAKIATAALLPTLLVETSPRRRMEYAGARMQAVATHIRA